MIVTNAEKKGIIYFKIDFWKLSFVINICREEIMWAKFFNL